MLELILKDPARFLTWVFSIFLLSIAFISWILTSKAKKECDRYERTSAEKITSNVVDFQPRNEADLKNKALYEFIQAEIELENNNITEYMRLKLAAKRNAELAGVKPKNIKTNAR